MLLLVEVGEEGVETLLPDRGSHSRRPPPPPPPSLVRVIQGALDWFHPSSSVGEGDRCVGGRKGLAPHPYGDGERSVRNVLLASSSCELPLPFLLVLPPTDWTGWWEAASLLLRVPSTQTMGMEGVSACELLPRPLSRVVEGEHADRALLVCFLLLSFPFRPLLHHVFNSIEIEFSV